MTYGIKFWNRWEQFGSGEERHFTIIWLKTNAYCTSYIWGVEIEFINLAVEIWGYR